MRLYETNKFDLRQIMNADVTIMKRKSDKKNWVTKQRFRYRKQIMNDTRFKNYVELKEVALTEKKQQKYIKLILNI